MSNRRAKHVVRNPGGRRFKSSLPDVRPGSKILQPGLAGDPELSVQSRHEVQSFVHHQTLLPRHDFLPKEGKSVTYVSGTICSDVSGRSQITYGTIPDVGQTPLVAARKINAGCVAEVMVGKPTGAPKPGAGARKSGFKLWRAEHAFGRRPRQTDRRTCSGRSGILRNHILKASGQQIPPASKGCLSPDQA